MQVRENLTAIAEKQNPKEFKEIQKDVSLRLVLIDNGGRKH